MKTIIIIAALLALLRGRRITSKTYTHCPEWYEDLSRFLDSIGLTVATVFTPSHMRPGRYYVTVSVSL